MRWRAIPVIVLILMFGSEAPSSIAEPATIHVPYRLTATKHILIRARINGHGPYNLVIDTGAPLLVLAKKLAEPVGATLDETQWADLKRVDIEGGITLENMAVRFDDLYQLEGMNGLGLAGVEIHGLVGYPVLARHRIEVDFNRSKMLWTPLPAKPDELPRRPGGSMASAGLQALGTVMKGLGKFIGTNQLPIAKARGFAGLSLVADNGQLRISNVISDGPAARAGLVVGDVVRQANGKDVANMEAFGIVMGGLSAGQPLQLKVSREGMDREIKIDLSEGF